MKAGAPTGVVTFLFTDIEGSTRRWEADPDAMRSALAAHDAALRDAIAAHDGWLFKHTGDGVCAVFGSPSAAVAAAIAAQRALQLPVRTGLATGEAELRDGDYFGAVLNRAARVMAAGHGGQILLDGTTADLLAGFDVIALGPRRLRDIVKPVHIWQVRAGGLLADFPPLRTLDATPGNLRRPPTSFVGRDMELAELETVLKEHRLVTLTGVGGVGKTRLALELAARSANAFPDGVWVIELAAIGDPAVVPEAVAAVLGITQQPEMSLADSIAAALEGRVRLLVFDNCEHVLDAAADMIEAILARSKTVKVLATSREGLRMPDEQLWPVPSLDVQSSASTLFVERASAVAPSTSLVEYSDVVAEICRRLDGIPLAIELAASRLLSMTVVEIRDHIDDRFRLLVGSRRGLERHQTLRHAVQWSYELLNAEERATLNRCSVFAGGFDAEGAQAVAKTRDKFATLDLLDALVRKSLVTTGQSFGRTRFSMLETIRQFAEEQLVADGEAEESRTAHARFFAGKETAVMALWNSPRQREAYTWLTSELSNLRTAFRWASDRDDLDAAAAIAIYATPLGNWIEQHEPNTWAGELIQRAEAVGYRRLPELYVMAAQCCLNGRIEEAIGYTEPGRLAIDSGRFETVSFGYETFLMNGYLLAGQPERCVDWCRDVLARDPRADPPYARLLLAQLLSIVNPDEAKATSDELLESPMHPENPHAACMALFGYGFVHTNERPDEAYRILRRGLKIAQDSGNRQYESHFALGLSRLALTQGDPIDALDFLTMAIRNHHDSGSFAFLLLPLASLGALFERLGMTELAATVFGFAATPFALASLPEIGDAVNRVRDALGGEAYGSLAHVGEAMSHSEAVAYAFEQIDLARAELLQADTSQ